MKQRRKELIECAIKLFAAKGFQATSVQDIVSTYGISKGAFYNYFSSKEELLMAIFQFYIDMLEEKMQKIQFEKLEAWDKMRKQIQIQFEFVIEHREFIMMYMREQNQTINQELHRYIENNAYKSMKIIEKDLLLIYGDDVKPYICDIIMVAEGFKSAYVRVAMFNGIALDTSVLSQFIMNRVDDTVQSFITKHEQPILGGRQIESLLDHFSQDEVTTQERIIDLLTTINEKILKLQIESNKKQELQEITEFLLKEIEKPQIKKYIFQGMLANFKEIKEIQNERHKIAELLNINLL